MDRRRFCIRGIDDYERALDVLGYNCNNSADSDDYIPFKEKNLG